MPDSDALQMHSGFDELYGLRLTEQSPRKVAGELIVDDRHLQPWGTVHGGVYAAMAEALASVGASLAAWERSPGKGAVGLENHTSFLRTAGKGTVITGIATPRHAGSRVHLWTVTLSDADNGKELALAVVRLAVVDVAPMVEALTTS